MFLTDSHCHLDLLDPNLPNNDAENVVARAYDHDVKYLLNVCVSIAEFPIILKTAKRFNHVAATVGLHPNAQNETVDFEQLCALAQDEKVVAIGETGLDYFRSSGNLDWQRDRFRTHIAAARALKKPLIIHTRDASDDTLNIMREEKAIDAGGVMHCFTENIETARKALDLGFYISFSGIVTFKSATQIQDTAQFVPLDRMLIETDAPYLAPNPFRGKPNEPAYVRYTAEFLANLRHVIFDDFAENTTQNFFKLFNGARQHV